MISDTSSGRLLGASWRGAAAVAEPFDSATLARVIRAGGRLVLFHPSGLAARHGRRLREDDQLAAHPLRRLRDHTGWWLARYDDGPDHFLATADQVPDRSDKDP